MDAPRHAWLATKRRPIGLVAGTLLAVALLAIIVYRVGRSGPNDSVSTPPDVQVIRTDAWGNGRLLLIRLAAPASNVLLLKSITEADYQAVASQSFDAVVNLTTPPTMVFRYVPGVGTLAPATEAEWRQATGPVNMCSQHASYEFPEGMEYKVDGSGRRLELHGRPLELAAKTYVRHYLTDDRTLVGVVSTTGQSSGTYFGKGAAVFSGTGFFEVFRRRDGVRVSPPVQLPEPVPFFGRWERTQRYLVFQYPEGIVIIPVSLATEPNP